MIIYARRAEQVRDIVRQHPAATIGVYDYPKKPEVCSGFSTSCPTRASTWKRMPEGHMAHACGRRHKDWRRRFIGSLFDILGMNLLPRGRTPASFQNPQGWDPQTKKRAHSEE